MTRVVFDTVGFVRGLINPLSRWRYILFDDADHYQLIVSEPVIRVDALTFLCLLEA